MPGARGQSQPSQASSSTSCSRTNPYHRRGSHRQAPAGGRRNSFGAMGDRHTATGRPDANRNARRPARIDRETALRALRIEYASTSCWTASPPSEPNSPSAPSSRPTHGEAFGECNIYGHPPGLPLPELLEVPVSRIGLTATQAVSTSLFVTCLFALFVPFLRINRSTGSNSALWTISGKQGILPPSSPGPPKRITPRREGLRPSYFLDRLFQAFGQGGIRPRPARTLGDANPPGRQQGHGLSPDLVWKPIVLIEMKKRGEDLTRHYARRSTY